MAATIEYKCPCCGGNVEFSGESQKMRCPFCETVFSPDELKEKDEVLSETPSQGAAGVDENGELGVYVCKSCGGELVTDANTAATKCPFCANPIILTGRLSGDLLPDAVLPFRLTKEKAKEELKNFMSGKKLVPRSFTAENRLDEIKGVYVPFWLFNAQTDADFEFRASRSRRWSDDEFDYEETENYRILRAGEAAFENVPVDGSKKMPDDLMESLEPFDYSETKPFQSAYLSGFFADKYDVSAGDARPRAEERAAASMARLVRGTVSGYDQVIEERGDISFRHAGAVYALLPVWVLNTVYRGESYLFAMNGQTGKFVGKMPMDKKAYWLWRILYTLIFAAVFMGVTFLLSQFFSFPPFHPLAVALCVLFGLLFSLIPMNGLKRQINNVEMHVFAGDYLKRDSFSLSMKQDIFVDRETNKTRNMRSVAKKEE